MAREDSSDRNLQHQIEALREQAATHRRQARAAESDAATSRTLLDALGDAVFEAHVTADGTVDQVRWIHLPDEHQGPLAAVPARQEVEAHLRDVRASGEPAVVRTEADDGTAAWRVAIRPATRTEHHPDGDDEEGASDVSTTSRAAPQDGDGWLHAVVCRVPLRSSGEAPTTSPASEGTATARKTDPEKTDPEKTEPQERPPTDTNRLVDRLPNAVVISGPDDTIRYANPATARLVQVDAAHELEGQNLWSFVHPVSRSSLREHRLQVRAGERVDYAEHKVVRADGSTVPVAITSVPIRHRGQQAALTSIRDLSGRREMASTLTRTLDLFDKAFHLGPSALAIVRLRDGMVLEVSEQVVELTGRDAHELVGQSLLDLDVWADPDRRAALARRLVREGTLRDEEVRLRHADGTTRTALVGARCTDIDGAYCALLGAVDITERKRAAQAIEESRTLLHKVFHASPAAISISRMADGQFVDANAAMSDLLGYDRETLLDATARELGLWSSAADREALIARLDEKDSLQDVEIALETKQGDRITALASVQRIQVEGEPCLLTVMSDITRREKTREALVEAKEQAEEVAQFRSALLSNVTHEMRTPLTVILGFTSMLEQGVEPEYERFVQLIERSGERLLLTLDSLIDLAQLESDTLETDPHPYSIPEIVHSIADPFAPTAREKDLGFALDLPTEHVYATVDYDLFERVLSHLIDNAIKFTKTGDVTVSTEADADHVYVHVRDTGVGIDDEFVPRLFDAFTQESEGLARTHQGSGLGLTVSKRIVERFGGTIRVESEKEEGSRFTIVLPRTQKAEADGAKRAAKPSSDRSRSATGAPSSPPEV